MKSARSFTKGRWATLLGTAFLVAVLFENPLCSEPDPKTARSAKPAVAPLSSLDLPVVEYTAHNRGNIQLAIANNGTFGTLGGQIPDPFTGEAIPSCIYPKASDLVYLWVAAVWIGAVTNRGRDTLVSCGNEDWYRTTEFWPDIKPFGEFEYKSIDINSPFYDLQANSEQDILCEYTDTVTNPALVEQDPTDLRPHEPLYVKVTQRSMAWSYSYADDFILFDYQIQNIGKKDLKEVYIGIYVDGDAWHTSRNNPDGWNDDIVGYYDSARFRECCDSTIPIAVNVAYNADNDGDPVEFDHWDYRSVRSAVGVRVVRTPSTSLKLSFNWWIINYGDPSQDFGPRRRETPDEPFRNFGARLGTPEGDANKYYVLSHEENDYDLLFTNVDHSWEGWLPPPRNADQYALGWDTRFLLSFGPFDISPGQKLPLSFAWVGGEDFHVNPSDFNDLFADNTSDPWPFYNSLDFSNLARNSLWASWVYDNPGVDTDGDGFFGPPLLCCDSASGQCDTVYCEGDGVPDFKAAGPPPAPRLKVIPDDGRLIVRWNGFYSENTPDVFSKIIDFEGYRLYIARDERPTSYSLLASYDKDNYNRYRLSQTSGDDPVWVLEDIPFTLDSLRTLFGDPEFDPFDYPRSKPLEFNNEVYYFEPQDYNSSDLTNLNGVHKVYPDAVDPGTDSSLWRPEDVTDEHGQSLPKFYEYEYVIEDLLATVPYYVAVTTFDFGSPVAGLSALETDPTNNAVEEYPQLPADAVVERSLDVYVYPNPYRIDANYRGLGYEGRRETYRPDYRVRALHFANLPAKCTISVYSLDGDLIKQIIHDSNPGEPQSSHEAWDLISRNRQIVVSGLYYYVVESEGRTQLGKFVIIE